MNIQKALRILCNFLYTNPYPKQNVVVKTIYNEETNEWDEWTYYGLLRFIEEERARNDKRGKHNSYANYKKKTK